MNPIHMREVKDRLLAHWFLQARHTTDLIRRFGAIQVDAVSIVAPNQQLVLSPRLSPSGMVDLTELYRQGEIVEVYAKERCIVLREDAPLFWPLVEMRKERHKAVLAEHRVAIRRVLEFVAKEGTITAGGLDLGTSSIDGNWGAKGLATRLIGLLWETGTLVVTSRRGTRSTYTLAPEELWGPRIASTADQLKLARWRRYMEGVGITDSRDSFAGFERCSASERRILIATLVESGDAVELKSAGKSICVVSTKLLQVTKTGRTGLPCFVPPLDNFLWHRQLVKDLWELDYKWEIYTPPAKRKYGAYAMPLVTPDGVYGPVDFRVNRVEQVLYGELSRSSIQAAPKAVKAAAEVAALKLAAAAGVSNLRLL
jgi:uncharacterized protein